MRHHSLALVFSLVLACLLTFPSFGTPSYGAKIDPLTVSAFHPASSLLRNVCGKPVIGYATCDAVEETGGFKPNFDNSPPYGPETFHTAYHLPCQPFGPVQTRCPQPSSFGPTVAIVDAYGDPQIEANLAAYSARFNLPACTQANGCLQIVNEQGQASPLPGPAGWEDEIALDVETVHGLCQTCKILLVEATSPSNYDLRMSVDTAASFDPVAISNSYGAPESEGDQPLAGDYNHPGIAIVASSGDDGYGVQIPASYPSVISVGGTSLYVHANGNYSAETAWDGAGSGCSSLFSGQPWQQQAANWQRTGCGVQRGVADVSADADPNTGAAIYTDSGWRQVGGTSLSAPIIASVIALAGGMAGVDQPQSIPYLHAGGFRDVTSGSNGQCASTMCRAALGYDGPTGLGSLHGLAGFEASAPVPTPTSTPSPTSTPTPSPSPTATSVPTSTPTPRPTATPPPQPFDVALYESYARRHHRHLIAYLDGKKRVMKIPAAWQAHYRRDCGGAITGVMFNARTGSHLQSYETCWLQRLVGENTVRFHRAKPIRAASVQAQSGRPRQGDIVIYRDGAALVWYSRNDPSDPHFWFVDRLTHPDQAIWRQAPACRTSDISCRVWRDFAAMLARKIRGDRGLHPGYPAG